jgi:glutamate N-acetyltransferase / amino-acid N-acetyltransferase
MSYSILDEGHVSSPAGFRATGISGGLKEIRARDLALVYSLKPCHAAAVFTTNAILAAPIFFNQAVLSRNRETIRAVLVNTGQANVGTGPQGLADAVECAKIAAAELEVPRDSVLLMSTGQIGVPLPMQRMKDAIRRAVSELDSGGGRRAAIALLMPADSRPKERAVSVSLGAGRGLIIGGMAKGCRLAQPRPVTQLAVLTTDALIDARLLARALDQGVGQSFGRLLLERDASPNDGVIILANGASEAPPIVDADSWEYGAWREGLDALCADLAQQVLRDAAASGKVLQVGVRGAPSDASARAVAQAVAYSPAVRWACAQGVADWGGMLAAVGGSGVEVRVDLLELRCGSLPVMVDGIAARVDAAAALQALSGPEVELAIDLHIGTYGATVWTCTSPIE